MNDRTIFVTKPVSPNFHDLLSMIEDIINSGSYTNSGSYFKKLEAEIKNCVGISRTVLTANGTDALLIALKASVKGKRVLTTPFTFAATINAIRFLDMEPIFCDIDPDTLCLDVKKARYLIDEVDAVLGVQVYGRSGNLEELQSDCKAKNIPLIIDASHSFGCSDELGNTLFSYGDISTTSFHATKAFSTVEGGAVFVNNEIYFEEVSSLINFGYSSGEIKYPGINSKMSELHAAIGICSLKTFSESVFKRKTLFNRYLMNLCDLPNIQIILPSNTLHNYTYLPILIKEGESVLEKCINIFNQNNISVRRYFYPLLSNIQMYNHHWSASSKELPNANYIAERVVCLPLYPDLSPHEVDLVCDILKDAID